MSPRGALTAALFAALFLILLYNQRAGLQARQSETCAAINETKAALVAYIDQQLDRSLRSLPTIDYYRRHPVELGKALSDLQEQREQTHEAFAPTSC